MKGVIQVDWEDGLDEFIEKTGILVNDFIEANSDLSWDEWLGEIQSHLMYIYRLDRLATRQKTPFGEGHAVDLELKELMIEIAAMALATCDRIHKASEQITNCNSDKEGE